MESEDKRPQVWVARRLMRRGCGCDAYPIAYFVSKARVQNVSRRFLRSGKEFSEYEVDFETPEQLEDLNFNGDTGVFVETGEYVKTGRVFKNYVDCIEQVDLLNRDLIRDYLSKTVVADAKEVIERHKRNVAYTKKLENYFDKGNYTDSRDNSKIF